MSVPEIVFYSELFVSGEVEEAYAREAKSAVATGCAVRLLDTEAMEDENLASVVRWIPRSASGGCRPGVYRGWMLKADDYRQLYEALMARGLQLINTPQQYAHCHHLPENYRLIADHTAKTVWLPSHSTHRAIMETIAMFGDKAVVLKDYVKSQKHCWHEACFIASASDSEAVRRVVDRFRFLQDNAIQGGLVFREYLDLEPIGTHPTSGMPLSLEYRVVVLDGKPVAVFPYWSEVNYPAGVEPPLGEFAEMFQSIASRFFTADLARTRDGQWVVIELGDAQVAEIPNCAVEGVYRALFTALGGVHVEP